MGDHRGAKSRSPVVKVEPPPLFNHAFQIHLVAICIKPRRLSFDLTQKPDPCGVTLQMVHRL